MMDNTTPTYHVAPCSWCSRLRQRQDFVYGTVCRDCVEELSSQQWEPFLPEPDPTPEELWEMAAMDPPEEHYP